MSKRDRGNELEERYRPNEAAEGTDLKRWTFGARISAHPVAAAAGGLVSSAFCTALGTIHSVGMAAAMAVVGLVVGIPVGTMLGEAFSSDRGDRPVTRF